MHTVHLHALKYSYRAGEMFDGSMVKGIDSFFPSPTWQLKTVQKLQFHGT